MTKYVINHKERNVAGTDTNVWDDKQRWNSGGLLW